MTIFHSKPASNSVLFLLAGVLVVACGNAQSGGDSSAPTTASQSTAADAGCDVAGVPELLRAALCSGDATRIRDTLFDLRTTERSDTSRPVMLEALRRIWIGDTNFGAGLPWEQLGKPQNKAIFVDVLAQAYRNQEVDVSLPEMQRFATELVSAERDVDQFEGVRLLGITDAKEQVPLLRRIALSNDPSVRRNNAIQALGYICDPTAKEVLQELAQSLAGREPDAMLVQKALEIRSGLDSSWCRQYTR